MSPFEKGLIENSNIINAYHFGSRVYGSDTINSDYDYVLVVDEFFVAPDKNICVYTIHQFQTLLNNCDIQILECFFIPNKFIVKEKHRFCLNLDKQKLRTSISTIASNSYVKGKKKVTVMNDYDLHAGLKSVFHSLRILNFGIQIAEHGKIIDYGAMNYVLWDLFKLSEQYQTVELWEVINTKYKSVFNQLSSLFKQLCPKDLTEKNKKLNLIKILKKYNVENVDLVDELLTVL